MSLNGYVRRLMGHVARADLSDDPDVQRCRAEREKRVGRKNPGLESAAAEFREHLGREREKSKGGRPRKKIQPLIVDRRKRA